MTRSTTFDDSGFDAVVLRGLIAGPVWDDGAISYYLEYSDADANGRNDWSQNGAADAIRLAFEQWANVANFTFTEATAALPANMIQRTYSEPGDDSGIVLGRHFYPGQNDDPNLVNGRQNYGEYNVNPAANWNAISLRQGGSAFTTLLHEIGHGVGLEHPHIGEFFLGVEESQGDTGFFGLNQGIYTTLTYNDGWFERGIGNQGTPMALDIAAVQAIYGANMSHATGDDVYDLGAEDYYASIWDAGGTDAIVYEGFGDARIFLGEATIDDTPTGGGLLSYVDTGRVQAGGFTVARGAVIENASGGSGDDLVVGNAGANTLDGNDGADILVGLGGADVINGGAGADIIFGDYESVATFGVALTGEPEAFVAPDLPDGLSLGSGRASVSATTANTTRFGAFDLSDDFALQNSPLFQDNESFHFVTVSATSGSGYGYYAFTLAERAFVAIDIDGAHASGDRGFDAYLYLENADGDVIRENDDTEVDPGSFDSYAENGDGSGTYDSGLSAELDAGTYYIRLGQWARDASGDPYGAALDAGLSYTLHLLADTYVLPDVPTLPEGALEQLGYYYETPDFSGVIGGYNGSASPNAAASKEAHDHDHGRACACSACAEDDLASADGVGMPGDAASLLDGRAGDDDGDIYATAVRGLDADGLSPGMIDALVGDLI